MTKGEEFARMLPLVGGRGLERLADAKVMIFGIGGVGSYVCEALARAGIGNFELVDKDTVDVTNINRQLIALHSTIGRPKTDVAAERIRNINPAAVVKCRQCFYGHDNSDEFDFTGFDYIVDAVDDVAAKVSIIVRASEANVPVISSMGTGNKLDPAAFRIADIWDTKVCPLARTMRKELRKYDIGHVKTVYSEEPPKFSHSGPPASISFVPAAAGLLMASGVIGDLLDGFNNKERDMEDAGSI